MARLREEEPLTLHELAEPIPMSRQAVTRHLSVLEAAGLVTVEWRGREKLHRLEARPLQVVEEWLEPYAAAWDRRLERLRRHLGEETDG